MSEKYDKNGYNSSDFKRNTNTENVEEHDDHLQDGEEGAKLNDRAGEYMRELLSEKIKLHSAKFPVSARLIDQEVARVQSLGRVPPKEFKYLDVYKDKKHKVCVKVLVPVKEHPKVNFVGKLLGPMGNNMKQLQEETMCKMAVLGRGSMRDRQKEEELRNSLDPKYAHLTDELHVEISALAPPAEAHARIAYALAEVKKYLTPEQGEMMRPAHMHDVMDRDSNMTRRAPLLEKPDAPPYYSAPLPPALVGSRPAPRMAVPHTRPMNPKAKVYSILDRARSAMDSSYAYEDPYAIAEPPLRGVSGFPGRARAPHRVAPEPDFYYDRSERFYEDEPYYKEDPQEYKTSAREVGTRRPGPPGHAQMRHYARASPYGRQHKVTHKKH